MGKVTLKALTTDQVTELCERAVKGTDCEYLGTYPAWGGPNVATWERKSRDGDTAFVANTDTVDDEGTHWTLFYLPKNRSTPPYFFDSFGRDPAHMGRPMWRNYLQSIADRRCTGRRDAVKGKPKWKRNTHCIQEPHTAVCGQLCGLALWLKARGLALPKEVVKKKTLVQFLKDV